MKKKNTVKKSKTMSKKEVIARDVKAMQEERPTSVEILHSAINSLQAYLDTWDNSLTEIEIDEIKIQMSEIRKGIELINDLGTVLARLR